VDERSLLEQTGLGVPSERRVVVAFDDSSGSGTTLEWATREANARQATLAILGPDDDLLREAVGAELLIGGASASGQGLRLLFSSVPLGARRSACPVVVVRGLARRAMRRILVGVDGSNAAAVGLDWAIEEADRHGADVAVVHASQRGAAEELVAKSGAADLLVVGSRGRSGFKTMLFGSVALAVVEDARCPVVVIHPQLRPAA
jgi:nucleotide-binding universal stress UspA family protein